MVGQESERNDVWRGMSVCVFAGASGLTERLVARAAVPGRAIRWLAVLTQVNGIRWPALGHTMARSCPRAWHLCTAHRMAGAAPLFLIQPFAGPYDGLRCLGRWQG